MRRLVPVAVLLAMLAVACNNGGSKASPTDTPGIATITQTINSTPRAGASRHDIARQIEADDDPTLPGEYIDLPATYGGYYGNQDGVNTGAHVTRSVDYSAQGLPPAGGPHWGMGACNILPAASTAFCGPVQWGIYREPWPAESLVHNMEHAGVIIWYNTSDEAVIGKLETFASRQLNSNVLLVLVPYPDMEAETIAITVWSRRDKFPVSDYDPKRLQHFIDALYCRFDPEGFCQQSAPRIATPIAGQVFHAN